MTTPTSRPRRRITWALALLIVIAAGGALAGLLSGDKAPVFETAVVERGNLEKTVTALGALRPKDYVSVGAQVSGQLTKVHVEIGDRVEAGQLLAEIDARVYESHVESSRANLERLEAQLAERKAQVALARHKLGRSRSLVRASAVSQQSLEESEAELTVAQARVKSLQAEIKAAQSALRGDLTNLSYTKIYAPMSGTVVSESAREGQTVNASQAAPEIVIIADLETMTVWAEVSEADVVKIRAGMPVYFTTLGMPERRWRGEVRQVQPTPQIVNNVVLYNVLIDIDNRDHLLMRDMTAQVFFVLDETRDAVLAPVAALKKSGDHYEARVLTRAGPERRRVELGLTTRSKAEVINGLRPGEQLVTGEWIESGIAADSRPSPGPYL